MSPQTQSGLWTLLIILVIIIGVILIIAALDRADAFTAFLVR